MLKTVKIQTEVGNRVLFTNTGRQPESDLERIFVKTFTDEIQATSYPNTSGNSYRLLYPFDEFNQGHHSKTSVCLDRDREVRAVKVSNYKVDPDSSVITDPTSIRTKHLIQMDSNNDYERAFALRSILEARFSFPHPYAVCAKDSGLVVQDKDVNVFILMDFINGISIKDLIAILHSYELSEGSSQKHDELENNDVGYKKALVRELNRKSREDLTKILEVETIRSCIPAAECLAALATEGFAHRDIKPSNIVLPYKDDSVEAHVIDFGIYYDPSRSDDLVPTLGKQAYLTPERHETGEINSTTDFFALSAIIWRILTGQNLLKDSNYAPILESKYRKVDKEFPLMYKLLEDSLHLKPKKRPSPEEYVTRLKEAVRVEFRN